MINCSVAGYGRMGTLHVNEIERHANALLNSVYDPLIKNDRNLPFAHSFEDACQSKDLDLMVIASNDDQHFTQLIKSIELGHHVFVEKPMCRSLDELDQIFSALKRKKISLVCNYLLRTAPLYVWLKEQIYQGRFGEIYALDGEYLYGRLDKIRNSWRGEISDYSVMQGGGIHIVDIMLFLLNECPSYVSSASNKIVTNQDKFHFSDFHSARYEFDSGIVANVSANFGCVHPHQHTLKIYGSKGTFILDDQGPRFIGFTNPEQKAEFLSFKQKPDSKSLLLHQQINDLSQGMPSPTSISDLNTMASVLYADESLKQNKRMKIEHYN